MAQLAIRGHATRGKEVIELLEMLGGKNDDCSGKNIHAVYSIPNDGYIYPYRYAHKKYQDDYIVFTLEEFLEKYPYKVGDKVLYKHENTTYFISKIRWENDKVLYQLSDEVYSDGCSVPDTLIFDVEVEKLQPYKEEEENFGECIEKTIQECLFGKEATMKEKNNDSLAKWDLPDGYEFRDKEGNVINTDTIRLVKKQPQTCEECLNVLGKTMNSLDSMNGYKFDTLMRFQQLLICRDAYWKIAGEQMGLGKPWEPDWDNLSTNHSFIKINKGCFTYSSRVFVFPTEEMRDAFYENFGEDIDMCKEFI